METSVQAAGTRRGSKLPEVKVIYYVQAILTIVGLILNFILLCTNIIGHGSPIDITCMLCSLVGFITVGYHCVSGYQDGDPRSFFVASWGVSGMLFFQSLIERESIITCALTILSFGLMLVFAERINNPGKAKPVISAILIILFVAAVIGLFLAQTDGTPVWTHVLSRLIPWTRLVLVGTIALIYSRYDQYA